MTLDVLRVKPATIGVFGISGVGKTTLMSKHVTLDPSFVHVQASTLIKASVADSTITSEHLRELPRDQISVNQYRLVTAFKTFRQDHADRTILLDAHSVIDNGRELLVVPTEIIEKLEVCQIIFVRDKPDVISSRRLHDTSRLRPVRSIADITFQQNLALDQCQEYSYRLKIPLNVVSGSDSLGLVIATHARI